jgi:uncharacterized membrane protein (DUF485 family)
MRAMSGLPDQDANRDEQRRRIRRSAVILGIVAALFYFGFILVTGLRGQ